MYDRRDRPNNRQMLLTGIGVVVAIVAVLGVGAWLLSTLLATPAAPAVARTAPSAITTAPVTTDPAETNATSSTLDAVPPSQPDSASVAPAPAKLATVGEPDDPAPSETEFVVAIDPGHQKRGDYSKEPIGPGSSQRKPKVAGGATGVSTRNPESLINLQVSLRLRDELKRRGVKVVMVRTKQDVNVSNSKRAAIANQANADLFIRIHCDGSSNKSTHGLSTLVPGDNHWTHAILAESAKAGRAVHGAVVSEAGVSDRGVKKRNDLAGFNWAKVPTILVEMGFMSNAAEDRRLASPSYQDELATGMADGALKYLQDK